MTVQSLYSPRSSVVSRMHPQLFLVHVRSSTPPPPLPPPESPPLAAPVPPISAVSRRPCRFRPTHLFNNKFCPLCILLCNLFRLHRLREFLFPVSPRSTRSPTLTFPNVKCVIDTSSSRILNSAARCSKSALILDDTCDHAQSPP